MTVVGQKAVCSSSATPLRRLRARRIHSGCILAAIMRLDLGDNVVDGAHLFALDREDFQFGHAHGGDIAQAEREKKMQPSSDLTRSIRGSKPGSVVVALIVHDATAAIIGLAAALRLPLGAAREMQDVDKLEIVDGDVVEHELPGGD